MGTWILIIVTTFSSPYVWGKTVSSIEFVSNKSCQQASSMLATQDIKAYCIENVNK